MAVNIPVIQNNNELFLYHSLESYLMDKKPIFPIQTFRFWCIVDFIFHYLKQFPRIAFLARGRVSIVLYAIRYVLFNDSVNSQDCVVSNDRLIGNNELERTWKEAVVS